MEIDTTENDIALAKKLIEDMEYQKAAEILNRTIKNHPSSDAYYQVGLILEQVGVELKHAISLERALGHLQKAVELEPSQSKYWIAVSDYYQNRGDREGALSLLRRSADMVDDQSLIYLKMYEIEHKLGQFESALSILKKLTTIVPNDLTYLHLYAKELSEMKLMKEALGIYEKIIISNRKDIPHLAFSEWLALYSNQAKCLTDIRERISEIYRENPSHPMARYLYVKVLIARGEIEAGNELLQVLENESSEDIDMLLGIASVYASIGSSDRSKICISKAIEIDSYSISALTSEARVHRYSYNDDQFERLMMAEAHLDSMDKREKIVMHYALGKAFDDLDDLSVAFEHYKRGGALASEGKHLSNIDKLSRVHVEIVKHFPAKTIGADGCLSDKPIFIIGMPRSGTTLLEQVISSADGIYGAGELTYISKVLQGLKLDGSEIFGRSAFGCFDQSSTPTMASRGKKYIEMVEMLAPAESRRIIDKLPDNFIFAGLICLMLPNASIIHSRRHPVEICLSAYRINFSDGLYWTNDLRTLGKRYRLYHEMMMYWKEVLPSGSILDVRYEDMVYNLESESRRIFNYLGIPWQQECLSFHTARRVIQTASVGQVHKPVYTTSIDRWHRYKLYLKPLLDEIGDLVQSYEAELEERY